MTGISFTWEAAPLAVQASSSPKQRPFHPKEDYAGRFGHLEGRAHSFSATHHKLHRQQGSAAGIQLAHAGRKASHQSPWKGGQALTDGSAWQTFAPSPVAFKEGTPAPKEMSAEDIGKVINDFKQAAGRALEAGFDLIEIHAAHGYLLHQFYSPLSNRRTDEYGGSFQNRIRLTLRVVEAVRDIVPNGFPLLVRLSATDWVDGGWTVDDSVALCKALKKAGVHLVDCSTGGNIANVKIPAGPLYQVPFAARIKREAGIMTGTVGMITTAAEGKAFLQPAMRT